MLNSVVAIEANPKIGKIQAGHVAAKSPATSPIFAVALPLHFQYL